MILFILWESWSGKTTLEHYLVNNYWFKMFDRYSTRPERWSDDKSWYKHVTHSEILAMWATWQLDECIKYNWEFYGMAIPHPVQHQMQHVNYVVVVTESWFQQFIDMGIEDKHDIVSIFLTNDNCEELMRKRWDDEWSIERRLFLNKRMRNHMWIHVMISWNGGTETVVELLKLQFPDLFTNGKQ